MATTLINLSGFSPGVQSDETGINIESIKTSVKPEFITIVPNKTGTARGKVVGDMMKTVTIAGEVSGTTGIMAATATTAFTASNSHSYFGASSGGLYLTSGDVEENRDGGALRKMTAEFEAYAGIS